MSKGLEALKELKETCETHMGRMVYILQEDRFEIIEKELEERDKFELKYAKTHVALCKSREENSKEKRALKIIKKNNVDIFALKISVSLEQYNCKEDGRCPLTQEEYNLLKEVLKDE